MEQKMKTVTEIASNIESIQKRMFDNAETAIKTTRGFSEGNMELFRAMNDDDAAFDNVQTVVKTVYNLAESNLKTFRAMTDQMNGMVARAAKQK